MVRKIDKAWEFQRARIERAELDGDEGEGRGNRHHGWWVQAASRGDGVEFRWRVPLHPLLALRALESLRSTFEAREREWVLDARATGHSWDRIGWALGISRQAAQQRHPLVDVVLAEMPLEP